MTELTQAQTDKMMAQAHRQLEDVEGSIVLDPDTLLILQTLRALGFMLEAIYEAIERNTD